MISGTVKRQHPKAQPLQVNKSYNPNNDYHQYVQRNSRTNSFWMFSTFALLAVLIVVLWDKVESLILKLVVRWFDSGTTENETTRNSRGLDKIDITVC